MESKRKIDGPTLVNLLFFGALFFLTFLFWPQIRSAFSNPQETKDFVLGFGYWGPLALILFTIFQVIVWPIPGYLPVVVGSYLYGFLPGFIYTLIGINVGTFIVLYFARKFGRPLVEKFVPKKMLTKWDNFFKGKGTIIFFMTFLIPGFPDDLIVYVAGLTKIPILTLLILSIVGRAPQNLNISYFGEAISTGDLKYLTISMIPIIALGSLGLINHRKLTTFFESFEKKYKLAEKLKLK